MVGVESEDTRVDNRSVLSLRVGSSHLCQPSRLFSVPPVWFRNGGTSSLSMNRLFPERGRLTLSGCARSAIKDDRIQDGKIDTSDLDDFLETLG